MKPIYPLLFLIVFSACNRPKEKIYLDAQPVSATTSFQGRVWDTGLDTCLPNAKLVFKRHKLSYYIKETNGVWYEHRDTYVIDSCYADAGGNFDFSFTADTVFSDYFYEVYRGSKQNAYGDNIKKGEANNNVLVKTRGQIVLRSIFHLSDFDSSFIKIERPSFLTDIYLDGSTVSDDISWLLTDTVYRFMVIYKGYNMEPDTLHLEKKVYEYMDTVHAEYSLMPADFQ